MASKGPIIAAGAATGVLFFWRRKRKAKRRDDVASGDEAVEAPDTVDADA